MEKLLIIAEKPSAAHNFQEALVAYPVPLMVMNM